MSCWHVQFYEKSETDLTEEGSEIIGELLNSARATCIISLLVQVALTSQISLGLYSVCSALVPLLVPRLLDFQPHSQFCASWGMEECAGFYFSMVENARKQPALRASLAVVVLWFWLHGGCEISLCGMQPPLFPFAVCNSSFQCRFQPAGNINKGQTALSRNIYGKLNWTGSAPPLPPTNFRMEPWASCMLNTCSPTELHSQTIS